MVDSVSTRKFGACAPLMCMRSALLASVLISTQAIASFELAGPPSDSAASNSAEVIAPTSFSPSISPATLNASSDTADVPVAGTAQIHSIASATESLPLGRAAGSMLEDAHAQPSRSTTSGAGWWSQTILALLFVIGLIFALRWGAQKLARRSSGIAWQMGPAGRAPSGVLEVLGRYPVARGQSLVLLRMDRRVLLLGQTSAGFATLSEVCDPEEVASLLVKTRDEEGASMAAKFNELLRDMERDPSIAGDTQEILAGEPATGARLPRIGLKGVTA